MYLHVLFLVGWLNETSVILLFLLSASHFIRGRHSESISHNWFGTRFTPDALPDTTLTIYPGLGLALEIHWLVLPSGWTLVLPSGWTLTLTPRDGLEPPINLTCMVLGAGRKPEYPERTHAYSRESYLEPSCWEVTVLTTTPVQSKCNICNCKNKQKHIEILLECAWVKKIFQVYCNTWKWVISALCNSHFNT